MKTELDYDLAIKTMDICKEYESEHRSGRLYITQTGLNKVAKTLGGDYKSLTKKQKEVFRSHCIDAAMDCLNQIKTWWYYINI